MRKQGRIFLLLLAFLTLAGCGAEQKETGGEKETGISVETEENGWAGIANGDMVEVPISEGVMLKAQVEMPEEGMEGIQTLHVRMDGFPAETYREAFGIQEPVEEWAYREGFGFEPEKVYNYSGEAGTGEERMPATLALGTDVYFSTKKWEDKYAGNYPVYSVNGLRDPWEEAVTNADLEFMDREEAIAAGREFLTEELGIEDARILQAISMRHEDMQKIQQNTIREEQELGYNIKSPTTMDDWSKEDDAYLLVYEQIFHGLPIVSYPLVRSDDFYIPGGTVELGLTVRGVERIQQSWSLEVLESRDEELLPLEEIIGALEKKYGMTLAGGLTLDTMKLVYYPYPTAVDPDAPYEFDLYPVWQFEYKKDEYGSDFVYINAVDGMEIVG